jgi:hypothetical protein
LAFSAEQAAPAVLVDEPVPVPVAPLAEPVDEAPIPTTEIAALPAIPPEPIAEPIDWSPPGHIDEAVPVETSLPEAVALPVAADEPFILDEYLAYVAAETDESAVEIECFASMTAETDEPAKRVREPRVKEPKQPRAAREPVVPLPAGFGIRAGVGVGGLSGHPSVQFVPIINNVPDGNDTISFGPSLSVSVGAAYAFTVSDRVNIALEAQYSLYMAYGSNVRAVREGDQFRNMYEAGIKLHSFEIPLLLRVNAGTVAGQPLYFEGGPQFGFHICGKMRVVNNDLRAVLNVFAIGPTFGAGIALTEEITVGVRAHLGLIEYVDTWRGKPWSVQFTTSVYF